MAETTNLGANVMGSNPTVHASEIIFEGQTVSPSGVKLGYIAGASARHTDVMRTEIDYHGAHHSISSLDPFSPWMEMMGNMKRNPLPECAWRGCPGWAIKAADEFARHNSL
jgi:hypothetical protein